MVRVDENYALQKYMSIVFRMIKTSFPHLTPTDITEVIHYSIEKRYKEEPARLYNNYSNKTANITLLEMTNYILEREPIITSWGVLWKRHGTVPNPLLNMIKKFMDSRGALKKEMFKYPKYSEQWEKYNLLQLLAKIDANGLYGVLGMYSCMYYNLHVAASVTTQGRSLVSAAGLCFESFLANNVKFGSLDQVITFIDNVLTEERHFNDLEILDRNITVNECFVKLITTCGFEWIPTEEELQVIWNLLHKLDQITINRLYYKNNLYEFMSNSSMTRALIMLIEKLEKPFLNPNEVPEEIKDELSVFCDLLMEYVYYRYQYIDAIDRMDNMIKSVCLISDTDSTIISLDAWYRFGLEKLRGRDLKILHQSVDMVKALEVDEFGELPPECLQMVEISPPDLDYDFYEDKTVEIQRTINMVSLIPQDNLRYSLINIIAYCLDVIINDYMERFTKASNSYMDGKKCLIIMKNEFLFKRVLLTNVKKNYASIQELQEGTKLDNIPDIKGLAIDKASMNAATRKALKNILYEDILNIDNIDQVNIIKKIAIFEDKIYKSLESGEKNFYKPVTIKSISSYDDPMKIQGIKASIVWNAVRGDLEAIDLDSRNAIDILKVNINCNNIHKIKDTYPEVYEKLVELVGLPKEKTRNEQYAELFKGSINAIAIPKDVPTPKWLIQFIDYTNIINDNIKNFPLESIGIRRGGKDTVNYTNIIKL